MLGGLTHLALLGARRRALLRRKEAWMVDNLSSATAAQRGAQKHDLLETLLTSVCVVEKTPAMRNLRPPLTPSACILLTLTLR